MFRVVDGGVRQSDRRPANCNEVEVSFGEMQSIHKGVVTLNAMLCGLDLLCD